MPGTILASLTGLGSDRSVLDAAAAAARIDGAHIQCLHTRIDVVETAALVAPTSSNRRDLNDLMQKISSEQEGRARHAREAFSEACKRHKLAVRDRPDGIEGVSIAWKESRSFLNDALHESRYHDFTVMSRDEELSRERIISVLMQSGRPLLLAPDKPVETLGRTVAIAWKEGEEAARALTAASTILSRAQSVVILSVSEDPAADGDRSAAEHLANRLAWRGIKAEVRMSYLPKSSTSGTLLDMAYACDADLLVMGAYGRSRVREFVFGGVTRDLLATSPLPLFMVS